MDKQRIKYFIQRKPLSLILQIQLKLHKPDFSIHPVVNSCGAPTYKVVRFLAQILNEYLIINN